MKKIRIQFLVISCILLASCSMIDFSEDCTEWGDVEVRFDWSGLLIGDTKPQTMHTAFRSGNGGELSFSLQGDTLLKDMVTGHYQVASYTISEGLAYSGSVASLPVYSENGKDYTHQAPLLYATNRPLNVVAEQTTLCELRPTSCIQQIGIDFIIIRENMTTQVESLSGDLEGVAIGYDLLAMKALTHYAALPFDADAKGVDRFATNLRVLGLRAADSQQSLSNKLNLSLQLTDGTSFREPIDLSGYFKGFTAPSIHITLEIRLSALGMTIMLTDWYTVNQGIIHI